VPTMHAFLRWLSVLSCAAALTRRHDACRGRDPDPKHGAQGPDRDPRSGRAGGSVLQPADSRNYACLPLTPFIVPHMCFRCVTVHTSHNHTHTSQSYFTRCHMELAQHGKHPQLWSPTYRVCVYGNTHCSTSSHGWSRKVLALGRSLESLLVSWLRSSLAGALSLAGLSTRRALFRERKRG